MHAGKCLAGALVAAASLVPVGVATAAPSGTSAGPRSTADPVPGPCAHGQLAVWIDTHGNGALGHIYYDVHFSNISTRACTLRGYPGVSAVNAAGRQLGQPASRSTLHAANRVVLSGVPVVRGGPTGVGGTATAILRVDNADNFPAARCGRATSVGLRVYPPNQKRARFVGLPFVACAHAGVRYLTVEAVRPGPSPVP